MFKKWQKFPASQLAFGCVTHDVPANPAAEAGQAEAPGTPDPAHGSGAGTGACTASEGVPVFDRDDLVARLGGEEAMVGRFIELFNNLAQGYLEALRGALVGGDPAGARAQAHTIKGASANISALRMRSVSASIEDLARAGSLEGTPELMAELDLRFLEFKEATRHYGAGAA